MEGRRVSRVVGKETMEIRTKPEGGGVVTINNPRMGEGLTAGWLGLSRTRCGAHRSGSGSRHR